MEFEKVTLYGGPGDGEIITLRAAVDQLTILVRLPSAFPSDAKMPASPIYPQATYRRSLNTKSIFVYQP